MFKVIKALVINLPIVYNFICISFLYAAIAESFSCYQIAIYTTMKRSVWKMKHQLANVLRFYNLMQILW